MAHDCFISYSHLDGHLAEQLSKALKKRDIHAWWDPELKNVSGVFLRPLLQALEDSKALVVIVSKNSADRDYVTNEVLFAKENGKPVIPLFAGNVPASGAVVFAVQLYQRVTTRLSHVEEHAVEEIASKLKNIIGDVSPALALDQLKLEDEEIPPLGNLETALQRACYRHFVHSVRDRNFAEAEQILQDIRNHHIAVRHPAQFEALQAWSKWIGWYEEIKYKSRTWGDLARSLAEKLPSSVTSPVEFRNACPPVASRLESEWWRIVDKVFEQFLRSITTGAWTDAARSLNSLDPTLLNPITPLIEGVAALNAPGDKSLFSCAHQVLEMYRAAPSENSPTFETLMQAAFPPDEERLLESRKIWHAQSAQVTRIQLFVQLLNGVAARCGGADSSAYQLVKTVEASLSTSDGAKDVAEFDEVLRLRKLWDSSLEELVSLDQNDQRLERVEHGLFEAGRVFAHAMQQAKMVGAHRLAALSHLQLNGAGKPWEEIIESLENCGRVVQELLDGLVVPLSLHWEKQGIERLQKVKSFFQQLSCKRKELQWKRETLKSLRLLVAGDPESALRALQALIHDDPELVPFVEPWVKVCEEYGSLVAGGDLRSQVDPNTGLPSALLAGKDRAQQVEAILSTAERADAALRTAMQTGFPLQEISIPAQSVISYLGYLRETLKSAARADWHSAERKLTAYVADASDPLECAWKLLAAIKRLAQMPAFFSVESVLTTAIAQPGARRPASNISHASMAALFAVLGQVEALAGLLKSHADYFPHNLGVAALSQIGPDTKPEPQYLSLAVSYCALFACSEKYREFLAQAFAPVSLPALGKGGKLRESVGLQLKKSFERAEVQWGVLGDPQSWACQWEVECFAVSQMSSQESYAPLPWPFGPALIEFYDLHRELGEVLQRRPALRVWYGPGAAGVAMNFSGDPESALRSLPNAETCTAEQAKASLGYASMPDPLKALQEDVTSVRSDVLVLLLNRDRFSPQTPPGEGPNIQKRVIDHCRELLELRSRGAAVEESFIRALIDVFTRMVEQLEKPILHLRRAATVEDAEARKRCMDGVLAFLSGLPDQKWLTNCVRTLRSFRSDVNRTLVDLKREQWEDEGKSSALLIEMQSLAEEATRDDPNDPHAKILKIRTLLLEGPQALPKVEEYLQSVQSSRSILDWPAWAAQEVQRLIRKVADQQE
ncbi:MAG TPA: toll/interleukin-1 receptor domain-containing protein [Candidatus Angelobacter sp.]|jgi:hypothetical protein|nr:toll/interleukin-1 receptor domain-containing protein [Candidatus Angelobacter sp.]